MNCHHHDFAASGAAGPSSSSSAAAAMSEIRIHHDVNHAMSTSYYNNIGTNNEEDALSQGARLRLLEREAAFSKAANITSRYAQNMVPDASNLPVHYHRAAAHRQQQQQQQQYLHHHQHHQMSMNSGSHHTQKSSNTANKRRGSRAVEPPGLALCKDLRTSKSSLVSGNGSNGGGGDEDAVDSLARTRSRGEDYEEDASALPCLSQQEQRHQQQLPQKKLSPGLKRGDSYEHEDYGCINEDGMSVSVPRDIELDHSRNPFAKMNVNNGQRKVSQSPSINSRRGSDPLAHHAGRKHQERPSYQAASPASRSSNGKNRTASPPALQVTAEGSSSQELYQALMAHQAQLWNESQQSLDNKSNKNDNRKQSSFSSLEQEQSHRLQQIETRFNDNSNYSDSNSSLPALQEQEKLWRELTAGKTTTTTTTNSSSTMSSQAFNAHEDQARLWNEIQQQRQQRSVSPPVSAHDSSTGHKPLSAVEEQQQLMAEFERKKQQQQEQQTVSALSMGDRRTMSVVEEQEHMLRMLWFQGKQDSFRKLAPSQQDYVVAEATLEEIKAMDPIDEQARRLRQIQEEKDRKMVEMACQMSTAAIAAHDSMPSLALSSGSETDFEGHASMGEDLSLQLIMDLSRREAEAQSQAFAEQERALQLVMERSMRETDMDPSGMMAVQATLAPQEAADLRMRQSIAELALESSHHTALTACASGSNCSPAATSSSRSCKSSDGHLVSLQSAKSASLLSQRKGLRQLPVSSFMLLLVAVVSQSGCVAWIATSSPTIGKTTANWIYVGTKVYQTSDTDPFDIPQQYDNEDNTRSESEDLMNKIDSLPDLNPFREQIEKNKGGKSVDSPFADLDLDLGQETPIDTLSTEKPVGVPPYVDTTSTPSTLASDLFDFEDDEDFDNTLAGDDAYYLATDVYERSRDMLFKDGSLDLPEDPATLGASPNEMKAILESILEAESTMPGVSENDANRELSDLNQMWSLIQREQAKPYNATRAEELHKQVFQDEEGFLRQSELFRQGLKDPQAAAKVASKRRGIQYQKRQALAMEQLNQNMASFDPLVRKKRRIGQTTCSRCKCKLSRDDFDRVPQLWMQQQNLTKLCDTCYKTMWNLLVGTNKKQQQSSASSGQNPTRSVTGRQRFASRKTPLNEGALRDNTKPNRNRPLRNQPSNRSSSNEAPTDKKKSPWSKVEDPDTGETFYWNSETDEVRWDN